MKIKEVIEKTKLLQLKRKTTGRVYISAKTQTMTLRHGKTVRYLI